MNKGRIFSAITSLLMGTMMIAAVQFGGVSGCGEAAGGGGDGGDDGGGGEETTALQGLAACTAQAGGAVICGTVTAADGTTPVAGATISLVSGGASVVASLTGLRTDTQGALTANPDACETDDVGGFACFCEGCDGTQEFRIGSGLGTKDFTASCTEGEVTNVAASETTVQASSSVQWLVVPGAFDGIQLLLSQLKDCTLTGDESNPPALRGSTDCEGKGLKVLDDGEVAESLKTETLSTYQAIFANCGSDYSFDAAVTTALQGYVNGGGNMYFSDLSDSWLTAVFPDLITFPSNKNATGSGTLEDASVVDTGLQIFLGSVSALQTTMDITFDWGVWTAMESVVDTWTTFIQGDISSLAPTLTGVRPITVGGPQESGCIFYTSYHVEGGTIGSDQETALRYLVLNRMNNCD